MKRLLAKAALVTLLGLGGFFVSGALLSVTTKKSFLGMYLSPKGLVISSHADIATTMCEVPEKKTVYFVGCGGL